MCNEIRSDLYIYKKKNSSFILDPNFLNALFLNQGYYKFFIHLKSQLSFKNI